MLNSGSVVGTCYQILVLFFLLFKFDLTLNTAVVRILDFAEIGWSSIKAVIPKLPIAPGPFCPARMFNASSACLSILHVEGSNRIAHSD